MLNIWKPIFYHTDKKDVSMSRHNIPEEIVAYFIYMLLYMFVLLFNCLDGKTMNSCAYTMFLL